MKIITKQKVCQQCGTKFRSQQIVAKEWIKEHDDICPFCQYEKIKKVGESYERYKRTMGKHDSERGM